MSGNTRGLPNQGHCATCPACGKLVYSSKRAAKTTARRAFPGEHLSPYRCERSGQWHLGHLNPAVMRGAVPRPSVRGKL